MGILVPHPQIHQQSPQRPPALSGSNNVREPIGWNNFPAAVVSYPPAVPRHQQFVEGSEHYTWATRAAHLQHYPSNGGSSHPTTAVVSVSNPPNGGVYHSPTATIPVSNPAPRTRLPPKNTVSHHQQRQARPMATTFQFPNSSPGHHPHPHSHDGKHHSPRSGNHGIESPSTGDSRTPQRSGHGTPNQSRRGSAICTNGPLQCHYRNCEKRCATDHEWREHKIHCRCRYQETSEFQCSFVECRGSTTLEAPGSGNANKPARDSDDPHSSSTTYSSLAELLAHERKHHQVLFCVDCQLVFRGSQTDKAEAHRQTCTAQNIGRPYNYPIGLGLQKPKSSSQQGAKIRSLWVKDVNKTLSHHDRQERADFVDLTYPERSTEERGELPGHSMGEADGHEDINCPVALSETVRRAMAIQLTGTLELHNHFLRSASDAVLELTPQEKDKVRESLTSMANLLRIELNTTGSSASGIVQTSPEGHHRSFSTPAIEVSTEAPTTNGPCSYAEAVCIGLQPPKVGPWADETEVTMNPSNEPQKCQMKTQRIHILSRSNSPSRGESASSVPPTADIQSSSGKASIEVLEPNLPISALRRVGTNTTVLSTEEGEPPQETHIPPEEQHVYFVQMMNCCLGAVYEWFEKNREVLLKNCECTILNAGDISHTTPMPEGHLGANPSGASLTKHQKRRLKKNLAAATTDAGRPLTPNQSGTPGDGTPTRPSVCLLHTVTSVDSLNLPRWTHHLRRLVEQGRIPPSIISNRDSFSGEIQPVDEVRHAVNKHKQKTDRDLLALVQQARKFCWQLKDWERCRQLDELYGLLEDKIKLVKDEEGWELAGGGKGSMRGRRGGRHGRSDSRRVVTKGLSAKGSVVGDTSGDDTEGGRRASAVKHAFTWPRMLGSDELIE